jgi:hypothetical protein
VAEALGDLAEERRFVLDAARDLAAIRETAADAREDFFIAVILSRKSRFVHL